MKDVFGGCETSVIGINSQVVSKGLYMAITSTYGRQIAEECNCGHPSGTVSPWASSGWEEPGGHLVHLLLKVQG